MNSEQKYWLCFWGIVSLVIIVLLLSAFSTLNARHTRRLQSIEAMVAQGYSPIAADCAADPPGSSETAKALICAVEARKGRLPKSPSEGGDPWP